MHGYSRWSFGVVVWEICTLGTSKFSLCGSLMLLGICNLYFFQVEFLTLASMMTFLQTSFVKDIECQSQKTAHANCVLFVLRDSFAHLLQLY